MSAEAKLRLGVNIDHVATVRNARGGAYPDPLRAARIAEEAGADGITAHLREDRRHISDADIDGLVEVLGVPLNFEMAATQEMQAIALRHTPHAVCLVPEKTRGAHHRGRAGGGARGKPAGAFHSAPARGGVPGVDLHRRRPAADRRRPPHRGRGDRIAHRRLLRRPCRGRR